MNQLNALSNRVEYYDYYYYYYYYNNNNNYGYGPGYYGGDPYYGRRYYRRY